ncbi:hypothetical protein [uncultured Erythrobacter sp.]|uniref:hypothetical protein n=1 Tax=uncultured Erythrobacter sp. TaxID=263913 RepID=UPI00262300CD|nr:hypothetical protein [uncultured Erythrobacter sp.]
MLLRSPVELEGSDSDAKLTGDLHPYAEECSKLLKVVGFGSSYPYTAGKELLMGMDAHGSYIDRTNSGKVHLHPKLA